MYTPTLNRTLGRVERFIRGRYLAILVAKPLSYYEMKLSDRNHAIAAAYASGAYTMHQIAEHFEVHYATVSPNGRLDSFAPS